jgi:two-component system response regulator FixJ
MPLSMPPHAPRHPTLVSVVDPDPVVRRNLERLLARLGAEVEAHATGAAFLAALAVRVPVCLVTAARLPDLSAVRLQAELRRLGYAVPTVVMSENGDVADAVASLRDGAIDVLEKPFIDQALATHIGTLLGR